MNIDFIVPTYNRTDHLMCIISSIVAQTNPNWRIHVVADNPPDNIVEKLNEIAGYYAYEPRIRFSVMEKRFNDFGHTPRNYGLINSEEEFVVMTGEDNYYVPTFVQEFLDAVNDDVDLVFCNMVLNGPQNQYVPIKCQIKYGKIDMGCFMSRTELGKQILLKTNINEADWVYVVDYLNKFNDGKVVHIDKILYVHN
jgi:glycosyltransferase involved in cell wall biosynthesis